MRNFFSILFYKLVHVINCFVNKKENSILIVPHRNCINDNYDIINYTADNSLVLCHHLLKESDFNGQVYMVVYDLQKVEQYSEYVSCFNKKIIFVNGNSRWDFIKTFILCTICCTCDPHYNFSYKTKKQRVICLGYFSPFKDDYHAIKLLNNKEQRLRRIEVNKSFSNHIVTSSVCGRIISLDTLLSFDKFIDLGFPRNDIFYKNNAELKERILGLLGDNIRRIICYTPTYRDYERSGLRLSDDSMVTRKTIWGCDNEESEITLEQLLEETDTIVIVKLHPWQEKSVLVDKKKGNRVVLFSELQKKCNCSLYDILAISDCLITDYTSTAFDYMHTNKPIIYYMYDFEKYNKNRGFSFLPVSSICGGPIAYSFQEMLNSLKGVLNGEDEYAEKRLFIHNLINKYQDGGSSKRVIDFILS